MTGDKLSGLSPKQTFTLSVSTGHLPKLQKNTPCPFCSTPLKATCNLPLPEVLKGTGAPDFRCNSKECNARVHPLSGSPVFLCGRGKDTLPLNTQAKVLFLAAWGTQLRQARAQTGLGEGSLSKAHARWRLLLRKWVEQKQDTIMHGGDYEEGEADEAVFRKKDVTTGPDKGKAEWHEFVGLKTRGQRQSLVLERRDPTHCLSKRAAPVRGSKKGRSVPPPYTQGEWQALAAKRVQDKFILHADGAPAYSRPPPGLEIRRDTVNHSCRNGGPFFSKKAVHKHLAGKAGRSKKATMAGTQSLDGWWGKPEQNLNGVRAGLDDRIDERVRESQWWHWLGSGLPRVRS